MTTWKALLLVYPGIDVRLPVPKGEQDRFSHTLVEDEIDEALISFARFPSLVTELSAGLAEVDFDVVRVARRLSSLAPAGDGMFWPSPDDVRPEIDGPDFARGYDSLFVLWPRYNPADGTAIPSPGWGFGMGASEWSNGVTYATVANAPHFAWNIPMVGEVWLHEWLHGVCPWAAAEGHKIPRGDADGGSLHDYVQSPSTGWMDYYRDLMSCNVLEDGKRLGIPTSTWKRKPQRARILKRG